MLQISPLVLDGEPDSLEPDVTWAKETALGMLKEHAAASVALTPRESKGWGRQ
jgi:hypothetical protein